MKVQINIIEKIVDLQKKILIKSFSIIETGTDRIGNRLIVKSVKKLITDHHVFKAKAINPNTGNPYKLNADVKGAWNIGRKALPHLFNRNALHNVGVKVFQHLSSQELKNKDLVVRKLMVKSPIKIRDIFDLKKVNTNINIKNSQKNVTVLA